MRPLLSPHTPHDRERLLEDLVERGARPIIRAVVRRELRGQGQHLASPLDAEDLEADTVAHILARLTDLADGFNIEPIRDFAAYVAVTAFHQCHAAMRQLRPERARLKNRLRYLLTHDGRFATWESPTSKRLCGLRSWNGQAESPPAATRLRAVNEPVATLVAAAGGDAGHALRDAWLVLALLRRAGGPVELDELTGVVALLLGLQSTYDTGTRGEARLEHIPDPRASVLTELSDREYLQRLWNEVGLLPVRQRVALLLNLRDENGRGAVALLPLTGTADIRVIAEALDIPAREFAELWRALPLDDAQIAERLGVTRQQVINLRKSARARLARRLRGA